MAKRLKPRAGATPPPPPLSYDFVDSEEIAYDNPLYNVLRMIQGYGVKGGNLATWKNATPLTLRRVQRLIELGLVIQPDPNVPVVYIARTGVEAVCNAMRQAGRRPDSIQDAARTQTID